ncbi:MAG: C25 family cysteine peptidase [Nanoarchaeota archaeon]|nr:C25 family cysteine peptidase [Nanoarchaeota archaeon]
MKKRGKLKLIFLILLGVIFLSQSVYAQTTQIVLKLDFPEPKIIKNVFIHDNLTYDSILIESLERYGNPGMPIMPLRTVRVLVPQGKDVQNIEIIAGKKITLDVKYKIEYGKTQVPHCSNLTPETKPNKEIYSSTKLFPDKLYSQLPLQNFRGYKILIINLYPVQYIPKEGLISYFEDMTVKVNLKPTLEINPFFRNLSKDKAEIIKIVDNPNDVDTYTKKIIRSHKGCIPDPSESYDYVIITNNELNVSSGAYTFQDLVNWKNQTGINATIVTVEQIKNDSDYYCDGTYGDGCGTGSQFNDTQAMIRNFIKDAYENWETEYVLLGGDGDGADVGGESGDNIIPTRGFYVNIPGQATDDNIPSDLYYAALDGSWNNDNDSYWGEDDEEDFYAEVYVGRAPVDSDGELSNFVNKTITYENISLSESYLIKALMLGEDTNLGYTSRFKDQIKNDSTADGYDTHGLPDYFNVTTLYDEDEVWTTDDLINEINNETHIINHVAHCHNTECMRLTNDNVDNDLENNWPYLAYSQGCYSAAFDNRDSFFSYISNDAVGEHHVTNNSHAAFAYLGNSRYGWGVGDPETDSASQRHDREFFDAFFREDILEVGKANQDAKEDNIGLILEGYSCSQGYKTPPCQEVMKWVYYDFTLLGDPETKLHVVGPKINQIQCYNSNQWADCSNIVFESNLTQVRTNCTDINGYIINATFKLENDTYEFFNHNATSNEGDWWIYDNDDIIVKSKNFTLTVTCFDNESLFSKDFVKWKTGEEVGDCTELNTHDTHYYLTNNIIPTSGPCCINITAQNITFDCRGYWTSNLSLHAYGVCSNQYGTTIKNCNISMNESGIKLISANNSYVFNNILNNNFLGLFLESVYNLKLEDNIINGNTDSGQKECSSEEVKSVPEDELHLIGCNSGLIFQIIILVIPESI